MNAFRIRLLLRSGIVTPLTMPTLWGHLAWGLRWRDGEEALNRWLDRYDAGDPPLVLSDPMPAGMLPMPVLPPMPPAADHPDRDEKVLRRRPWIPKALWNEWRGMLSMDRIAAMADEPAGAGPDAAQPLREATILHAAINRLTGGTQQEGGGTLFAVEQAYPASEGAPYDVYARFDGSAADLHALLDHGLHGGYGRDGATGMGWFTLSEDAVVEEPLPLTGAVDAPDACLVLGRMVPGPQDPRGAFCRFVVHAGRLGGAYAQGDLPDEVRSIQKHPVLMIERGSILRCDGPVPSTTGRVLRGVHPDLSTIRHCGLTLCMPVRLDEYLRRAADAMIREDAA